MLRYKLRTLMILVAVGPPLVAGFYLYPAVFIFISGLLAFSCWIAAIGGLFGKIVQKGGLWASALLLLVPLLLPPVMGSRSSPTAVAAITVSFFHQAIDSYWNNLGELPPDLDALLKPPRGLPKGTAWGGPYLGYEELPVDPWREKYQYAVLDKEAGKFKVWSKGPDRRSHTEDDISWPLVNK